MSLPETYLIDNGRRYWITPNTPESRLLMNLLPIHYDEKHAWVKVLWKKIYVARRVP